jgi:hypothetical protein
LRTRTGPAALHARNEAERERGLLLAAALTAPVGTLAVLKNFLK